MNKSLFKERNPVPTRWYTRAAGAAVACAVLLAANTWSSPSETTNRQTVHNTGTPSGAAAAKKLGHALSKKKLNLAISLPLRDKEGLTNLLAQIYDPTSPNYKHYLTSEQFAERFGPTKEDYEAVANYATSHGLKITTRNSNRAVLGVEGTVFDVERALHVTINEYQHPTEKRTFYAPDREASVDIGVPLLDITGLNDFVLPKPHIKSTLIKAAPTADGGSVAIGATNHFTQPIKATPMTQGSGANGLYEPKDFRAAYLPGAPITSTTGMLTGNGQCVGVLELSCGYEQVDVTDNEVNLDGGLSVPIVTVLIDGYSGAAGSGDSEGECVLDLNQAMGCAPGLKAVYCYEGVTPDDILASMASQNTCSCLSCSWGWSGGASPDQSFLQMAAQGQSFFCASGDTGTADYTGTIDIPDGDPNICMVGGTSLFTSSPAGPWLSEVACNTNSPVTCVGGGGIDSAVAIPSWQLGISMAANYGSTQYRNVPDVSGAAENLLLFEQGGGEYYVAGTSASTPMWAAFIACANQLAAANGQPNVGFICPAIYNLGKGLTAHSYTSLIHDITVGNIGTATAYPAVPGYDLATGWGTPASTNLLFYLGISEPLTVSPYAGVVFTGPAGGPFTPSATTTYTLTNSGSSTLNWSIGSLPSWLDATATGGTLVPGGPSTNVTISIDPSATNLALGAYTFSLPFNDLSDNFSQDVTITLAVSTPPSITLQPTNQSLLVGQSTTLAVGIASNGVVYYQWQTNGVPLAASSVFSGVNSNILTITGFTATNASTYSVVVSNALGAVTSSAATIAVTNSAPVLTLNITNTSVLPGGLATLSVLAYGNTPYTYRWYYNNPSNQVYTTSVPAKSKYGGTNSPNLSITNFIGTNVGYYAVIISNTLGTVTSTVAHVTTVPVSPTNVTLFVNGVFGASGTAAATPYGGVVYDAAAAAYYGTTGNGGADSGGAVFKITTAGSLSTEHSFNATDGIEPVTGLCLAKNADFYATTYEYGTYDNGTLFQITTGTTLTTEVQFNGDDGSEVQGTLIQGLDGNLYGTASGGGLYGYGTVFKSATNGVVTNLMSFNSDNGAYTSCELVQGTDGNLYGTSQTGGDATGDGTAFKISTNGVLGWVSHFNGTNGTAPFTGVIQANDGNFYGTTLQGGAYGFGTVFQMLPNGTINTLYSFTGGTDGSEPWGSVIQGTNGNLYGATLSGGTYGDGTVFSITLGGNFSVVAQFDGFQGSDAFGTLCQGPDGNIYGTAAAGGPYGSGTFFSITNYGPLGISGQPLSLTVNAGNTAIFTVATTGNNPTSYQWQDNGTNIINGGQFSGATSSALVISSSVATNAGNYSVIVSNAYGSVTSTLASLTVNMTPPAITAEPASVTAPAGSMAFFSVTATGDGPLVYHWLQNGSFLTDGGNILGSGTSFLSVSNLSASAAYSVIITNAAGAVTSTVAALTVVSPTPTAATAATTYSFGDTTTGATPDGTLIQGKDGYLYGTASDGGSSYIGAVFRATLSGNVTNVYSFSWTSTASGSYVYDATNGAFPLGGLVQAPNGNLYGTCQQGGANGSGPTASTAGPVGPGSLFRLTNFTTISATYSFAGSTDGEYPDDSLVIGTDNNLYGTAYNGGADDNGSIFQWKPNGTFSVLYSFTGGSDGANPQASLIQGPDGNFYGTATDGGANADGTAFSVSSTGAFTLLGTFTGANGSTPIGGLVLANDGNYYGTTANGGAYGYGTVYRLSTNTGITTIFSFAGTNGLFSEASLIQGKDGNLYGTASGGGLGGQGVVFLITTNGAYTPLLWFDGFNGADPEAALVQATDGNLYGVASQGSVGFSPSVGYGGWGTIFKVALPVFATNALTASNAVAALPYSGTIAGAITPAGDTISYSLVSGPAWLSVSSSGALSGTPSNTNIGTNTFVIGITDATGFYGSTNLLIKVVADPAPTFINPPYTEPFALAGAAYTASIATNAVLAYPGDTLTYGLVSGPSWLSVSASGALAGTPTVANVGTNTFVVSATDLGGATNTATVSLFVDTAPAFSASVLAYAPASVPFAYTGTLATNLIDPAIAYGATVTYSLLSAPTWLTVAPNGALSGTPNDAEVGTNLFAVEVIDSYGLSSTSEVALVVNPDIGPAFVANPFSEAPASAGVPYLTDIATNAVESNTMDTLTFALVSGPSWLTIATNGVVSGTPLSANAGTNTFVVSVTDLDNQTATATMLINVTPASPITSSIVYSNGLIVLSWTGGVAPYTVLTTTNLGSTNFTSAATATNSPVSLAPCTNSPVMFYLIQGN